MKLFLCEKPSQARDIGKVLGVTGGNGDGFFQKGDIAVTWAFGHILTQAMPDAYGEQFKQFGNIGALPVSPEQWVMHVSKEAQKQFKVIKGLLGKSNEVVIATDADREGEVIAREILDYCQYRQKVSRLWLQALDEASVKKALANILPGSSKASLYQAGLARSRADWLIGMNLSRAYTVAYSTGFGKEHTLSVGRVQTPTLSLVVHRDQLIENFKSYPYYVLSPVFKTAAGESLKTSWRVPDEKRNADGYCTDKNYVEAIASALLQPGVQVLVTSAQTERKKTPCPLPYSLSALQKEASRRFNVSVSKVLDVAQALYEKYKVTSYPRTPCQYLPVSQKAEVPTVLQALVSLDPAMAPLVEKANPAREARVWNDKQVAKASHHAIIPTAVTRASLSEMTKLERDIYDMIRRRYLAQFYSDYEYDSTVVVLDAVSHTFVASGVVVYAAGWKVVTQAEDDKDKDAARLPALVPNDVLEPIDAGMESKKTSPPAHFTESTLLDEMKTLKTILTTVTDEVIKKILRDTEGLGTEATRGNIIQRLLEMGYLDKQKKGQLHSTQKARDLIAAIPAGVADPITTAKWELALSGIEQGKISYDTFMNAQAALVTELVEEAKAAASARTDRTERPKAPLKPTYDVKPGEQCPICNEGTLSVKTFKNDTGKKFLGCSVYGCKFFQWFSE